MNGESSPREVKTTPLHKVFTDAAATTVVAFFILALCFRAFGDPRGLMDHIKSYDLMVVVLTGATSLQAYYGGYYELLGRKLRVNQHLLFLFSIALILGVYTGILLFLRWRS
jgi:hypothetical protein